MKSTTVIALLGAAFIPATTASWCELFYDSGCTNSASGGVNYDCKETGSFGNGGGFIKCHATSGNSQDCWARRFNNDQCFGNPLYSEYIKTDGTTCHETGGAGPYYCLGFTPS